MGKINKKSFIIHLDMLNVLDELDDKQAGKLLKAIREYQLRLVEKDNQDVDAEDNWAVDDFVTRITFAPFKAQFDRDFKDWLLTSKKNKENIKKRWNTKDTIGINGIQITSRNTDNDNDNDNEKVKEDDDDDKTREEKSSPTAAPPVVFGSDSITSIDNLAKEALQDQVNFVEHIYRQFRIDPQSLPAALDTFNRHLKSTGELMKRKKDYRIHFQNWIRKQSFGNSPSKPKMRQI